MVLVGYMSGSTSFNPCFPGTRSSTISVGSVCRNFKCVSILVFLELALRLGRERLYHQLPE